MKKYRGLHIFLFFVFLNNVPAFSQGLEVRYADVEKGTMREIHEEVLGSGNGSYDMLRYKFSPFGDAVLFADHFSTANLMRSYTIEVFKKDLYKNNQIRYKINFENAFRLDSTLIVLFSSFNPDKSENSLYAIRYTDGYMIGDPEEILKLRTPNRFEKGSFVYHADPVNHTFFVAGIEPAIKNTQEVYHIVSFNQDLSPVWKQNLVIPYKENRYELSQVEFDENKRIFLLFRIILNKEQKKQQELPNSDYYFSLLQLSETQDEDYLETVLNIEDKNVYNMCIDLEAKPGKILLSGLYYNKKSELKPKGVYFAELGKDSTQPERIKLQPFADDFIPDFETESPFTEITDEEPEIKLIDLLAAPAGGYFLISEYVLINETCVPDYRTALMNCNYNYYYNDIFIFKFDSTGSLEHKFRIPKKQFTRNDQGMYSSFAYGFIKNQLVLLYNDHPKNLKPRNPTNMFFMTDAKKSNLAAITIDAKGNVQKEHILNNDKRKTWCKPKLFFSKKNEALYIFSEKGRLFQTVEIK